MINYQGLKEICCNTEISHSIWDNFLIDYALSQDKIDTEFENRLNDFRHVCNELPATLINLFKSQYIIHRVLKQDGLIRRYILHPAIQNLDTIQLSYILRSGIFPWRYSFSKIISSPGHDFYEMEDIFTGESFLLYSPFISTTLAVHPVSTWFSLIVNKNFCWRTFGPVGFSRCFDARDIIFFATELNNLIESVEDLLNDIENNPVPYMLLMLSSNSPTIMHGGFETAHVTSFVKVIFSDMEEFRKDFKLEYTPGVYKITHNTWSAAPHFAEAFYDEEKELLVLYGLTDNGYQQMASKLNEFKLNLPIVPDVRIHQPLIPIINKLVNREVEINPYRSRFEIKPSVEN
jgi:hypothetical protein